MQPKANSSGAPGRGTIAIYGPHHGEQVVLGPALSQAAIEESFRLGGWEVLDSADLAHWRRSTGREPDIILGFENEGLGRNVADGAKTVAVNIDWLALASAEEMPLLDRRRNYKVLGIYYDVRSHFHLSGIPSDPEDLEDVAILGPNIPISTELRIRGIAAKSAEIEPGRRAGGVRVLLEGDSGGHRRLDSLTGLMLSARADLPGAPIDVYEGVPSDKGELYAEFRDDAMADLGAEFHPKLPRKTYLREFFSGEPNLIVCKGGGAANEALQYCLCAQEAGLAVPALAFLPNVWYGWTEDAQLRDLRDRGFFVCSYQGGEIPALAELAEMTREGISKTQLVRLEDALLDIAGYSGRKLEVPRLIMP